MPDNPVTVTITLGAQKFAPVQYHSFDIGPYSATVVLRDGETYEQAHARVMPMLRAQMKKDFEDSLGEFLDRVRQAATRAGRR